ncbi:DinB family protein [Spongiimicrobium salis]|uniref:DinB family protein n=1 Tax=Spongiimicrobium salis TaxID=1667022 RepID=UPI00374D7195
MTLKESIRVDFQNEMNTTKRFFESMNDDKFSYRPHEKSMEFGTLVNHLVQIPSWVPAITGMEGFDFATQAPPKKLTTKAEVITTFEANVANALHAIDALAVENLEDSWTLKNGETVYIEAPKYAALRNLIISHTVHHRAQLGVYLRLNDQKVPASYVASADESLI